MGDLFRNQFDDPFVIIGESIRLRGIECHDARQLLAGEQRRTDATAKTNVLRSRCISEIECRI